MVSVTIDRRDGLNSAAAIKGPCRVATTANITLSGLQTIDGVALAEGDRVLVKDQTDARDNGIRIASTGNWERSADFRNSRDIVTGTQVYITHGATNAYRWYGVTAANPISVGETNITFTTWRLQPVETHPLAGTPSIIRESEDGHSWAIGAFEDLSNGRTVFIQTRGPKHGVSNSGGMYRYISRDNGITLKEEQSLLVDALYDSRYAVCGEYGSASYIFVKQTTEDSNLKHIILKSTDFFYSNVSEIAHITTYGHHPHGQIMSFPASLGGSDTAGMIVYSYGGNNIRSIRTTDDWVTVTEDGSSIVPPDGITSLAEPYVVECGAPEKRWMLIRVESPDGADFYGSYSTNAVDWAHAYPIGIYGGKVAPFAKYDEGSNRVYLYRVNRPNPTGGYDTNFPANALLWTWEDADRLMAGGTVRRDWTVSSILPDFATGYLNEFTINGHPAIFGTCGESNFEGPTLDWTTSRGSRTKHFVVSQTPLASGVSNTPNKNELRNPQFRVWQNGTSFTEAALTSSSSPLLDGAQTADEVFVAVNAGVTGSVTRADLPARYEMAIPGGPNYGLKMNFTAGDNDTDEQYIRVRKRDVSRWAGSTATWTLWIRGTPPSTMKLRVRLSYDGSSYDETASSVVLTPLRTTEDITVLSATIDIPSVVDDTITSSGLVIFELRTTNEATDYTICSWKLEEGSNRTELLPMSYEESLALCRRERLVFGGKVSKTIVPLGSALLTTSWEGALTYGPMNSIPTITASGSASDFEIRSSAPVTLDSLPTFGVIDTDGCVVTAAVTGASQNRPYRLRTTASGGSGKVLVETGF